MLIRTARHFLLISGLLAAALPAAGQSAALLNGGGRAFLTPPDGSPLDIDLRTGNFRRVEADDYGTPFGFVPGAALGTNALLGMAGQSVYAFNLDRRKAVRIYEAPSTATVEALAANPKDGGVLIRLLPCPDADSAEPPETPPSDILIYIPEASAGKPGEVFSRRVSRFDAMAFGPDGTFYFATRGDIWAGQIEPVDPPEEGPSAFVLTAERVAPVATSETYLGTPVGIGADELAVTASQVYFHAGRMGGSGWGNLAKISVPRPVSSDSDLEAVSRRSAAALSSLQVLGDQAVRSYLTASPDGRHLLYLESGNLFAQPDQAVLTVVEDGKPPRLLKLTPK